MFSKLCIGLTLCTMQSLCSKIEFEKAQESYHNTPQYKQWKEFKEKLKQDKMLDKLNQDFFDAHKKCEEKQPRLIRRSSEKCLSACIQAQELSERIVQLKNQLHELEEIAIQTNEGQEYLRCRLEYHQQLQISPK